jgi:DNA replication protein DnaC
VDPHSLQVQDSVWVRTTNTFSQSIQAAFRRRDTLSRHSRESCRDAARPGYVWAAVLFRKLNLARANGTLRQLPKRLNRVDALVVDDWAMAPMSEAERRDFWEIAEDRYQTRSMILTSQLPVSRWHEQIGDPTLADSILDRLVHNAHRIEMRGESMRKQRGEKGEK